MTLLLPECEALVALGFELVQPVRVREQDVSEPCTRDGYHLVHRAEDIHAYVRVGPTPDRARPVLVLLESHLERGMLVTTDARYTDALTKSERLIRHFVESSEIAVLLDAHRARRLEMGTPLRLPDEEVLRVSAENWNGWLDDRVRTGGLVAAPEPGWLRMTVTEAFRFSFRRRFDAAATRRARAALIQSRAEAPAPVEEEVANLTRVDALFTRPLLRRHSLAMFAIGTLLFVGWFGLDDWDLALALTAVVLFHELGHAAAMRLVGYRDVRIYFVPFMGGATSGAKRDANIHQEVIATLAGPVPGLVLALVAWPLLDAETWQRWPSLGLVLTMLVAVNYLNLLPVFPLDGGKIVHRIVAGRLPAIEIAVRLVAIALLACGVFLDGGGVLAILAVLLAFGTPAAWRAARLERSLRRAGADRLPPTDRLAAIFRALPADVRGWTARLGLARQLQLRLDAPDASWIARACWAVVYLVALAAPTLMLVFFAMRAIAPR